MLSKLWLLTEFFEKWLVQQKSIFRLAKKFRLIFSNKKLPRHLSIYLPYIAVILLISSCGKLKFALYPV